ncbi:MAG TPA: hypothetical protein VGE12_06420 [Noviherbaspirillum sp.]
MREISAFAQRRFAAGEPARQGAWHAEGLCRKGTGQVSFCCGLHTDERQVFTKGMAADIVSTKYHFPVFSAGSPNHVTS